jgi:hypothetical protein
MIVVRRTFFCKVGQASRVVEILREFVRITKESGIPFTNQLVMTDLVGKTDRVVWTALTESVTDPRARLTRGRRGLPYRVRCSVQSHQRLLRPLEVRLGTQLPEAGQRLLESSSCRSPLALFHLHEATPVPTAGRLVGGRAVPARGRSLPQHPAKVESCDMLLRTTILHGESLEAVTASRDGHHHDHAPDASIEIRECPTMPGRN